MIATALPRDDTAANETTPTVLEIGGEQVEVIAVESGTAPTGAVSPDVASDRLVSWIITHEYGIDK